MAFSNWLCSNSSKNLFVKIVYPGGHVELHDRPVLASEIMLRNPRCCVAHPHVFQQPWATVPPETILMLGEKFYVVPINTVRKLQRFSLKYSPVRHLQTSSSSSDEEYYSVDREHSVDSAMDLDKEEGSFWDFKYCCFWVAKAKGNGGVSREERRSILTRRKRTNNTSSTTSNGMTRGSPKRFASLDRNWQPGLESITEE
ncbi:hypothetical protein TorRG33x02_232270 [Trema orientale]|uniref:Uncharacterized protein n=1 Tax=Trema orientale TaxID=63057 RepID=A0A2P5E616_TREOI|nr:hypothetical protein TorRG33x02_232270 [Trema orientale]